MVTTFSEPGGNFEREWMPNEGSDLSIMAKLREVTNPGGVYIGVGPEQNFTFIATLHPKLAFIVDIRRMNLLEHLMYKALFELSMDRADFLSQLLSRKRPNGLNAISSVDALFDAYKEVASDRNLYDKTLIAVIDCLTKSHHFELSMSEKSEIANILDTFFKAGPSVENTITMGGGNPPNPNYAELMMAEDPTGRKESYLASEEHFSTVREMQIKNLIVPVVGDFAGDSRFTALFEALAIEWLKQASQSAVSKRLGMSWDEVHSIMDRAVKRGMARRQQELLPQLGIDEKAYRKGHDYVTVVTDATRSRVLYVAQAREEKSLDGFWETLNPKQLHSIEAISLDMWDAYLNSIRKHVPDADEKIVFDKFHIAQHLTDAVDRVRRTENKELQRIGDSRLKGTRFSWLRNPVNLGWHERRRFTHLNFGTHEK